MITPDYARAMTHYNAEMNRRLYGAAGRLSDAERRENRGAFWGSIHGTFSHLIWADQMWMSRFDGWQKPTATIKESATMVDDWPEMQTRRLDMDARLEDWAARLTPEWMESELTWWSGAAQKEMTRPKNVILMHFFNHQTHHRGQAHAMLTSAGEKTGDTDLMLIVR